MDLVINRRSMRREKARYSVRLSGVWIKILYALFGLTLFAGIALVVADYAFGWVLIGLTAAPAMIIEWYKGELRDLPPRHSQSRIDDVLSADVLGRISATPSPSEVAAALSLTHGGQFFAVRLGISPRFLQEACSKDSTDMQAVWEEAISIREQTNSSEISAAVMVAALTKNTPNYLATLGSLQLSEEDLLNGIDWYNHLQRLIQQSGKQHRTGGLARDWSFGWTPLLDRFSQNISDQAGGLNPMLLDPASHGETVDNLVNVFSKGGRQNTVLIGSPGAGKTQIVHAFAARLLDADSNVPSELRFRQVFMLDASSLIAAAPGRGELENLIPSILNEAYRSKNTIICLDNAQLFFEDGTGSVDIANVLLPILEAGRLRMILTMDEQRYLQIEARRPEVANALNRIAVTPASRNETMAVLQDKAITLEFQHNVTYMYQALGEAYRLGERYVHDLAMPGQALRLFEAAANYSNEGLVTAKSVQDAIEKTMDVKVGIADSGEERKTLLNLEELLHKRMVNQTRAVSAVSDALRRARAGVRNTNRPIGTFLFLGPTGVGKSELAKALAATYFNGEKNIIRVDLNEYVANEDVARLIADGADDANSLTARAMKQPFSVVLLDEIEKAHPNVITTLLQMLDEGILRDIKNREVSFRDAIIIATSNAGADRIREYIERGHDIAHFEKQFIDELISSNQFRPEFLNRFDEIVVFRPLNRDELLQVVDHILADVNKTLELQKVSVEVAEDAKVYLVEQGYDPKLGARPMRRVVQRAVESTVAKRVLEGGVEPGGTVEITLEQVQSILETRAQADEIASQN